MGKFLPSSVNSNQHTRCTVSFHRAGAWTDLEMDRPHGAPQNNYGLSQSKEATSLFGCVLGLGEVEKAYTETLPTGSRSLDPGTSYVLTGQTALGGQVSFLN